MFRGIIAGLAVAIAALLIYVGLQPSTYRVERSATIAAPPQAVFDHINELRKWEAWSPWAKRDPNAKAGFEGPQSGTGAIMTWSGNDEVGEGRMEITGSTPAEAVRIKLDFVKPMEGTSDVAFALAPDGAGTRVTWSIDGEQGYVERLICTVLRLDMEEMIGRDYEQGLAQLKTVAEAGPKA